MNEAIFESINGLATHHALLDSVMIFSSAYLPYLIALCMAAMYLAGVIGRNKRRRQTAVHTAVLLALNLLLAFLIGQIWYEPRPFLTRKVNLLYPHVSDSSFPSDHATATLSIALGLGRADTILGIVLALLSGIVGVSRVYVGHHYPFDILGSYALVFLTEYLYHKFVETKVDALYAKMEKRMVSAAASRFHKA